MGLATPFLPFTVFHKVGIVPSYSYSEIVKPERCRINQPPSIQIIGDSNVPYTFF